MVIELKAGSFDAACVGQVNLYLSAVDDLLRHPDDKPSIGLLLCRSKDALVVEYALRDLKKPIGVARWETDIVKALPRELEGSLPTVEEIAAELAGVAVHERRGSNGDAPVAAAPYAPVTSFRSPKKARLRAEPIDQSTGSDWNPSSKRSRMRR